MPKCDNKCFIEKAMKVHGDLYDYSLVEYVNNKTKVQIICKEHGVFRQAPGDHTSHKNGCPKCADQRQKKACTHTKEQVVSKFKKIWGDLYDYSNFNYVKSHHKSEIICAKHGKFYLSAACHLQGGGCKGCTKDNIFKEEGGIRFLTEEVFLERARKKHKNAFEYPNLLYINPDTKIEIKCKKHNFTYKQNPRNHLQNKGGCPKCKAEAISRTFIKQPDTFLKEASEIHGGFYSYKFTEYTLSKNKVIITCPIHGDFEQISHDHLRGHGCNKCGQRGSSAYNTTIAKRRKKEWLNISAELYLIELKSKKEHYLKIGVSKEGNLRYQALKRVSGCRIIDKYSLSLNLYDSVIIEQRILKENIDRIYLPSTNYPGHTECFKIEYKESLINMINKMQHYMNL